MLLLGGMHICLVNDCDAFMKFLFLQPVTMTADWSYDLQRHLSLVDCSNSIPLNSIYGATTPSGPWPPSEGTSILLCLLLVFSILLFLRSVMCPSGQRPPILFLVFPLVLYYDISH